MNPLIEFLVKWSRPFPSGAPVRTRHWSMDMGVSGVLYLRMEVCRVGMDRLVSVQALTEEAILTANLDVVLEKAKYQAAELERVEAQNAGVPSLP